MSHDDALSLFAEQIVQVAIAARGFVAHVERLIDAPQCVQQFRQSPSQFHLFDHLAMFVENANGERTLMNIDSDRPHSESPF